MYLPKFIRGCCVKTGIKTWYMKYSVQKSHRICVSRVKFYKTKGSRFWDFRIYVHNEAGDQIWGHERKCLTFLFKTNQHLRLFFKAQFNNCVKTVFLKFPLPCNLECPFSYVLLFLNLLFQGLSWFNLTGGRKGRKSHLTGHYTQKKIYTVMWQRHRGMQTHYAFVIFSILLQPFYS